MKEQSGRKCGVSIDRLRVRRRYSPRSLLSRLAKGRQTVEMQAGQGCGRL